MSTNNRHQQYFLPPSPSPPSSLDHSYRVVDNSAYYSHNTSTAPSSHTSNASMWSLHHHFSHSRSLNSTPPTPSGSPSPFHPPPYPHLDRNGRNGSVPHLHPVQYRLSEYRQVVETHLLNKESDPTTGKKYINQYEILEELGRGVHGTVKLGKDINTGELVAIKIVNRSQGRPRLGRSSSGEAEKKIRREIAILKKCRHENVVGLLEVIDDPQSKKVYLVLEYLECGEILWRQPGNPDLLRRERHRLRREIRKTHKEKERHGFCAGGTWPRPPRRKDGRFWSLEFSSDFESPENSIRNSQSPKDSHARQSSPEPSQSSPNDSDFDSNSDSSVNDFDDLHYVPALTIESARSSFRETVLGLEYLHYHGIIHRDIKPANLLWTKDHRVKISDFGVSFLGKPVRDDEDTSEDDGEPTGLEQDELELAKTAGTPAFFAPELCYMDPAKPRPQITAAIDVWALGVTLYCLIFARCPFMAENEFALLNAIAKDELLIPKRRIRPPRVLPSGAPSTIESETEPVDADLRDLLRRLLTKDPVQRITLMEVKRHPWVLQGISDKWADETYPEGNKIEVTTEDVDKAVSGVFGRVRKVIKNVADLCRGGLRKRTSSTADVLAPSLRERKENGDEDSDLPWLGAVGTVYPLSTNTTNGSSSDTVQQQAMIHGNTDLSSPSQRLKILRPSPNSGLDERRLRHKQSVILLGQPVLRRYASADCDYTATIRASHLPPTVAPPSSPLTETSAGAMKAESTSALTAPNLHAGGLFSTGLNRIVRSMKSGNLAADSRGESRDRIPFEVSPMSARDALAETLQSPLSQVSECEGFPYHSDFLEFNLPVNNPRSTDRTINMLERFNLTTASRYDRSYSQSPDEIAPDMCLHLSPALNNGSLYHPDGASTSTSPITMRGASHDSRNYFALQYQHASGMPSNGKGGNQLVSSSSEEHFATTAGSSLTNSSYPSVPSIVSQASSVSSGLYSNQYSRKGSLADNIATLNDDEGRRRLGYQMHRHHSLDPTFNAHYEREDADGEYDSDESDGGFVLEIGRKHNERSGSVSLAMLARDQVDQESRHAGPPVLSRLPKAHVNKNEALSPGRGNQQKRRRRSASSSATVKERTNGRRRDRIHEQPLKE